MKFALALLIAVHFWHARNVEVPCHPVAVENADAQLPKDAYYGFPADSGADVAGCRVLVSSTANWERKGAGNWYCMDIVHEVGHLAGLEHTPTGIMAAYTDLDDMPYDCQHWRAFRRNL